MNVPRALTIAGSDSSGGAGIQADLKTFGAFGVYGASVITAVTAQNTHGVRAIHPIPAGVVRAQLDAVFDDLRIDAVKVGMLGAPDVIEAVRLVLEQVRVPIVIDPVMVATSGDVLLPADAIAALRTLFPLATLVTPNLPECAVLMGGELEDLPTVARNFGHPVLIKGGHREGPAIDLLYAEGSLHRFVAPRIETTRTHGTGCTLSSAIASRLAHGDGLVEAIGVAKVWLTGALSAADDLAVGSGHGPVNHLWAKG